MSAEIILSPSCSPSPSRTASGVPTNDRSSSCAWTEHDFAAGVHLGCRNATLERKTREKDAAGANAVRALYRMQAREVLARIAADPMHPRSVEARYYLGLDLRL